VALLSVGGAVHDDHLGFARLMCQAATQLTRPLPMTCPTWTLLKLT
jgi:hypothetical protein